MVIEKEVTERFSNYIFDWQHETYVSCGGYGSGKSYNTAFKIILKLLQEKRKALVVRDVYETIKESCFDLFCEILSEMNLLADSDLKEDRKFKVVQRQSPMQLKFPNGSRIIFKGMDKPTKVKSINDVSIVWIEEASEIKYAAYKEILGRVRTPKMKMHFLLTFNPVGRENWVYSHFFKRLKDNGEEILIVEENRFYKEKEFVVNGVYYHHSTPDDNPYLQPSYIKRLDDLRTYDFALYLVARHGRFGAAGTRVLPQFEIAKDATEFKNAISAISYKDHYFGFDFGFEDSYNALLSMAVDTKNSILYIYDEIYVNHLTDSQMIRREDMKKLKEKQEWLAEAFKIIKYIVADNADPKAIKYYNDNGFKMRPCRNKFAGSRLSNTRKVKRFKKIICSPKCKFTIRELRELTYAKDQKGNTIYDQFNIDPHTFSAIWYGLDMCTVADVKDIKRNSEAG